MGSHDEARQAMTTAVRRVLDARSRTSTTLASALRSIDGVAASAEGQVRSLDHVISRLSGASRQADIVKTIQALEGVVSRYLDAVTAESQAQLQLAEVARARTGDVMRSVAEIERIAFAAKLVSLNAIVTAETLQGAGPLSVIAMSMAQLTEGVAQLNRTVAEAGARLVAHLELLEEQARALREESLAFFARFRAALAVITPRASALQTAVDRIAKDGESSVRAIVEQAQRARAALGFETEFAAALDGVEARVVELETMVSELTARRAA